MKYLYKTRQLRICILYLLFFIISFTTYSQSPSGRLIVIYTEMNNVSASGFSYIGGCEDLYKPIPTGCEIFIEPYQYAYVCYIENINCEIQGTVNPTDLFSPEYNSDSISVPVTLKSSVSIDSALSINDPIELTIDFEDFTCGTLSFNTESQDLFRSEFYGSVGTEIYKERIGVFTNGGFKATTSIAEILDYLNINAHDHCGEMLNICVEYSDGSFSNEVGVAIPPDVPKYISHTVNYTGCPDDSVHIDLTFDHGLLSTDDSIKAYINNYPYDSNFEWDNNMLRITVPYQQNDTLQIQFRTTCGSDPNYNKKIFDQAINITQPKGYITIDDISCDPIQCYNYSTEVTIDAFSSAIPMVYSLDANNWQSPSTFTLDSGIYTFYIKDDDFCDHPHIRSHKDTIVEPLEINFINIHPKNIQCFGENNGEIHFTMENGISPFSYEIAGATIPSQACDTVVNNLLAGSYTITATDNNGCQKSFNLTLSEPDEMTINQVTKTDLTCHDSNDGKLQIDASFGSENITYFIEDGLGVVTEQAESFFDSLAPDNYKVSIRNNSDNACTIKYTGTAIITAPEPLEITSIEPTDPTCHGDSNGQIIIHAHGGTSPYLFSINNGDDFYSDSIFTDLPKGQYDIKIMDAHGCTTDSIVHLFENEPLHFALIATPVACFGGSSGTIEINELTGGTGQYFYHHAQNDSTEIFNNHIITNQSANTYHIAISDTNGCLLTHTIEIIQPQKLDINFSILTEDDGCGSEHFGSVSLSATEGNGAYNYFLSSNPTDLQSSGLFHSLQAGNYTAYVSDLKNCIDSIDFNIDRNEYSIDFHLSANNIKCNGNSDGEIIVSNPTGGYPDYTIFCDNTPGNGTFENQPIGSHTIQVTDARECLGEKNIELTQPEALQVSFVRAIRPFTPTGNEGEITIHIEGGTPPYHINYTGEVSGNLSSPTPGEATITGLSGTNNATNTYEIIITDSNYNEESDLGCTALLQYQLEAYPKLRFVSYARYHNPTCQGFEDGYIELRGITGGDGNYTFSWSKNGTPLTEETGIRIENLTKGYYEYTVTDGNGIQISSDKYLYDPDNLQLNNIEKTNITCFSADDGVINIELSGGTSDYIATIQETGQDYSDYDNILIENLQPDTYHLTITDYCNHATFYETVTINEPEELTGNYTAYNTNAPESSDGKVAIQWQGGTAPYNINYSYKQYYQRWSERLQQWIKLSTWKNQIVASNLNSNQYNIENLDTSTYIVEVTDANNCSWQSEQFHIYAPTAPLSASISIEKGISCYGEATGQLKVNVEGGNLYNGNEYQIQWYEITTTDTVAFIDSTNIFCSNLVEGKYGVMITDDNNIQVFTSISLNAPEELQIQNIETTPATCFGSNDGSIIFHIAGGSVPYQYLWNDSLTSDSTYNNLIAGNYTGQITGYYGCDTVSFDVPINEPDSLEISLDYFGPSRYNTSDGYITIKVKGGTAPYNIFVRENGFEKSQTNALQSGEWYEVIYSNLNAGTFDIQIIDDQYNVNTPFNGCINQTSVTLIAPPPISSTTEFKQPACPGSSNGSITVHISNGGYPFKNRNYPYDYQWYELTGTDTIPTSNNDSIITNIPAGEYLVQLTDSIGEIYYLKQILTDPSPLNIELNITDASCDGNNDGSVQINTSGGSNWTNYYYKLENATWTTINEFDHLDSGTYALSVNIEHECQIDTSFTVNDPSPLFHHIDTIQPTKKTRNDGQISFSVQGGTSPYQALLTYPDNLSSPVIISNNSGIWEGIASDLFEGRYILSIIDHNYNLSMGQECLIRDTIILEAPDEIIFTFDSISPTCFGYNNGQLIAHASGGEKFDTGSPYTYQWYQIINAVSTPIAQNDSTITNISEGTYSVFASDKNGLTGGDTIFLSQPDTIFVQTNQGNVHCFGGNDGFANISLTGGTKPYFYSWDNGKNDSQNNDITSGSYSVLANDSHNCLNKTFNFNIEEPESPLYIKEQHLGPHSPGGKNGYIYLTFSGGTPPYELHFNNEIQTDTILLECNNNTCSFLIDTLSAGNYSFTIYDDFYSVTSSNEGCNAYLSVSLTDPDPLKFTYNSINPVCHSGTNGEIEIHATGGYPYHTNTPYHYLWEKDIAGTFQTIEIYDSIDNQLSAGKYKITIRDSVAVTYSETITLSEPVALSYVLNTKNISCNTGSDGWAELQLIGQHTPYHYSWSNGANSDHISNVASGEYFVVFSDANYCETDTVTFQLVQPNEPITPIFTYFGPSSPGSNDGYIHCSITGGTKPYHIQWMGVDTSGLFENISAYDEIEINDLKSGLFQIIITDSMYNYTNDQQGCSYLQDIVLNDPDPITINFTTTHPTCHQGNNGLIQAFVTGGYPYMAQSLIYEYKWYKLKNNVWETIITNDNKITNLTSEWYLLEATDSLGISRIDSIFLPQPEQLTNLNSFTNETCYNNEDGIISIKANGEFAPYTFLIEGNKTDTIISEQLLLDNLPQGNYQIQTIDYRGCDTLFSSFTIGGANEALSDSCIFANPHQPNGNEGYIEVWLHGGTTPYEVSCTDWDHNIFTHGSPQKIGQHWVYRFSNLSRGHYTIFARDNVFNLAQDQNNCTISTSGTLSDPLPLQLNLQLTANLPCYGDSSAILFANAQGGTPSKSGYNYQWYTLNENNLFDSLSVNSNTLSHLPTSNYKVTVNDSVGISISDSISITQPDSLEYLSNQTNLLCYGASNGSIHITGNGGIRPYRYHWSNNTSDSTISNLTAGFYKLLFTDDNGCNPDTTTFEILEPQHPVAINHSFLGPHRPGGNNGYINLEISGGTRPYTLVFSSVTSNDTISINSLDDTCYYLLDNLTAGSYSIDIFDNHYFEKTDNNGCTFHIDMELNDPDPLLFTSEVESPVCNAGSNGYIFIHPTGGYPFHAPNFPYHVNWYQIVNNNRILIQNSDTILNNLTAGKYLVEILDSVAVNYTDTILITEPNPLISSYIKQDVWCHNGDDGSAIISTQGETQPYQYIWNNGLTIDSSSSLIAGSYWVKVTDKFGCDTLVHQFEITQPEKPLSTAYKRINPFTPNGTEGKILIESYGGTGNHSINAKDWNNAVYSPDSIIRNNDTSNFYFNNLASGYYYFETSDFNHELATNKRGCSALDTILLEGPDSLKVNLDITETIKCYGDPTGALLANVLGGTKFHFGYIFNWYKIDSDTIHLGSTSKTMNNCNAGTYLIEITDSVGLTVSDTLTINQPDSLQIFYSQQNIACYNGNDGEISTYLTGGSMPYQLCWENNDTTPNRIGLSSQQYCLNYTDAFGCFADSISFNISQPDTAIQLHNTVHHPSQPGVGDARIEFSVFGGNTPYTVVWSNHERHDTLSVVEITNDTFYFEQSNLNAGNYIIEIYDYQYHSTESNWGCYHQQKIKFHDPDTLNVRITGMSPTCYNADNGVLTAYGKGGYSYQRQTLPYRYEWSYFNHDSWENLLSHDSILHNCRAGNYVVNIFDSLNIVACDTFYLDQPDSLQIQPQISHVSCYGGSNGTIELDVSGESGSYNYHWENSVNESASLINLPAGFQNIRIVDNKGCDSAFMQIEIQEPDEPVSATFSRNNPLAPGKSNGSFSVTIHGGTPPYQISCTNWHNEAIAYSNFEQNGAVFTYSFTQLPASTYTLNIQDSLAYTTEDNQTCTETFEIELNDRAPLLAGITVHQEIDCHQAATGALEALASGGTPYHNQTYQYSWYKYTRRWVDMNIHTSVAENLTTGYYQVAVSDSGQTVAKAQFYLNEPDQISHSLYTENEDCFAGRNGYAYLELTGGTSPYLIEWDEHTYGNNVTSLGQGNHQVTFTDAHGCIPTMLPFEITGPQKPLTAHIEHGDVFTPKGDEGFMQIVIAGGTPPYNCKVHENDQRIFESANAYTDPLVVNHLQAGIYHIEIEDTHSHSCINNSGCLFDTTIIISSPDTLLVQIITDQSILCHNDSTGMLTAQASGGTNNDEYQYTWFKYNNDGTVQELDQATATIKNLGHGTYQVLATDNNGITATDSVLLPNPAPLTFTSQTAQVQCFGESDGSITILPDGGTPPYNISWNNQQHQFNLTDQPAGSYSAILKDDNGCTIYINKEIPQPLLPLSLQIDSTHPASSPTNSDAYVAISVSGGTPPYEVSWAKNNVPIDTGLILQAISKGRYHVEVTDFNNCSTETEIELTSRDKLLVGIEELNEILCNEDETGKLKANVTGGYVKNSYQFLWQKEVANEWTNLSINHSEIDDLSAGLYRVIVTDDNGMKQSAQFELPEPAPLNISSIITPVSCKNGNSGAIEIQASGGTSPYSFEWDNGQNSNFNQNLPAGDYECTLKDRNGCTVTQSFSVEEPILPLQVAVVSRNNPVSEFSFDGSITIEVSGGWGNYTIDWKQYPHLKNQRSASQLGPGTYLVEIKDSVVGQSECCTQNFEITLDAQPPLVVELFVQRPISCYNHTNGALRVKASGGKPFSNGSYKVQWYEYINNQWQTIINNQTIITNLAAGEYKVQVTDLNGSIMELDTILDNPDPLILFIDASNVGCGSNDLGSIEATVSGGTAPYNYSWNNNLGTNSKLEDIPSGTYHLTVTDAHSCQISGSSSIIQSGELNKAPVVEPALCLSNCQGRITLNVQGGSGEFNYEWNNPSLHSGSEEGLCAGTYSVYVSDKNNSCYTTASFVLDEPVPPSVLQKIELPGTLCANQSYLLDATLNGASYLWESNMGFSSTQANVELSEAGQYLLTLVDSNACTWQKEFQLNKTDFDIGSEFLASSYISVNDTLILVNTSYPEADRISWELPKNCTVLNETGNIIELIFTESGSFEIGLEVEKGECREYFTKLVEVNNTEASMNITKSLDRLIKSVKPVPNPASANFAINIELSRSAPVQVKLIRYSDSRLVTTRTSEGSDQYSFPIGDGLPTGTYVISTHAGSEVKNVKILVF